MRNPPDPLGQPLVEVGLLGVDLPVLLLLDIDWAPLVVGHESILYLGTKASSPEGGDNFAKRRVRLIHCQRDHVIISSSS